jgi:hypothetical protein
MTEGQKYFIEKFIKIKQSDGSFQSITLTQHQLDYLEALNEAHQNGRILTVVKGKYRSGFDFVNKLWTELLNQGENLERSVATDT